MFPLTECFGIGILVFELWGHICYLSSLLLCSPFSSSKSKWPQTFNSVPQGDIFKAYNWPLRQNQLALADPRKPATHHGHLLFQAAGLLCFHFYHHVNLGYPKGQSRETLEKRVMQAQMFCHGVPPLHSFCPTHHCQTCSGLIGDQRENWESRKDDRKEH